MPQFKKQILRPGTYHVVGLDGKRRPEDISLDRIALWVDSFKKMREAGVRVPAPWGHKGLLASNEQRPEFSDPRLNAGFWNDLWIDPKTGDLYGQLEVPDGHPDADKIGTTVVEVSPMVLENWTDGNGKTYKEAPVHIALCTSPVVPGQENFEQVKDAAGMVCSLLMQAPPPGATSDNAIVPSVDTTQAAMMPMQTPEQMMMGLLEAMRNLRALGLDLPPDTNPMNFIERINVAARAALSARRTIGMDIRQEPSPVVMSNSYELYANALAKQNIENRLKALEKTGRLTAEYRKKHIDPLLSGFKLALDKDGNPEPSTLESLIAALESIPVPRILHSGFKASTVDAAGEPPDAGIYDDLDEEQIDSIIEQQFSAAGYAVMNNNRKK